MFSKMEKNKYSSAFERIGSLQVYKCSHCNRSYSLQVGSNTVFGRAPLLFPCSHVLCDECVQRMIKVKKIKCKQCKYEMKLDKADKQVSNMFPVDRYLYGTLLTTSSPAEAKSFPVLPAGASMTGTVKKNKYKKHSSDKQKCSGQDCKNTPDLRCLNCYGDLYCKDCDKKVHESVRILKSHVRYPIDEADLTEFNINCVEHPDIGSDYYCITCDDMLCSKCVIKSHSLHSTISVEEKNTQELPGFKETVKKAKTVLHCMESTHKKIKNEIDSSQTNSNASQTEIDIVQHFSMLHSIIQNLEIQMLENYYHGQTSQSSSLKKILTELESNIEILAPLVSTGTSIKTGEHFLISEFKKKLESYIDLPCELTEDAKVTCDIQSRFVADTSIIETIEKHCKIDLPENSTYKLIPKSDFNDLNITSEEESSSISSGFELQTAKHSFISHKRKNSNSSDSSAAQEYNYLRSGCKTRVSLSGNVPTMYGPVHQSHTPKEKQQDEPVVLVKGTEETVNISHINNPSSFYVQLTRKRKHLSNLTNAYENYVANAAIPVSPEIGNLYLVQYPEGKHVKWYRGRIVNELETGISKMYEIFFIDYGNSTITSINKIREIKPSFLKEPPFAFKCRIHGLVSKRTDWDDEVLKYMVQFVTGKNPSNPVDTDSLIQMISNAELKMHVVNNENGILEVHLYTNKYSISDCLIFSGNAKSVESSEEFVNKLKHSYHEKKILSAISNFKIGEVYKVFVTHVVNPFHLYIQLAENKDIITNLESALSSHFVRNDPKQFVFKPEIGTCCAVKTNFHDQNTSNWRRAEVTNILGNGYIEIFFLDYGITQVVLWDKLRKLKDVYKSTDAQAIKVSLADIVPKGDNKETWPENVTTFLKGILTDKYLSMYVNNQSREKLTVTIYESLETKDVCINAFLVKENLAVSTGDSSVLIEYEKLVLPAGSNVSQKQHIEKLINNVKTEAIEMKTNNKYSASVEMVHIDSPDCFYVTLPKWTDIKLKLFKLMQKYYSKQTSPEIKWNIDTKCIIQSKVDRLYYRAVIIDILENDMYEVFMKDVVRTEIVPTKNMYEFAPQFGLHDFTVKCRLGGMKPPGGSDKWPQTTIEYFKDLIKKHPHLYMTKTQPSEEKTVTVNLISKWEENNGPLQPSSTKELILNLAIIDAGLALPVRYETIEDESEYGTDELIQTTLGNKTYNAEENNCTDYNIDIVHQDKRTSWLHSYRISEKQFKAWPSYVDHDGFIYLHTVKSKSVLSNIHRILDNHFKNIPSNPNHVWNIGDMCTVQYHLDKSFCRGTVTDLHADGKISVFLIDYGNNEECSPDELRTEPMLTDIPVLAIKCVLANVTPKTKDHKWPIAILDTLHLTIVEKECEIFLENENCIDEIPPVTMFINNVCVNTTIMEWDWEKIGNKSDLNKSSDDDQSVIIDDNDDIIIEDDSMLLLSEKMKELKYDYIELPEQNNFEAVVINIIDYKTIIIEAAYVCEILKNTLNEFENMLLDINNCSDDLPKIDEPFVGLPCIALFGADNCWYRAEILSIDKTGYQIKILFVDYGNLEVVPLDDIKQIKQEWLNFPVQMLKCNIAGIRKAPGTDEDDLMIMMKELIVDKHVICEVKEVFPEIEVKLIDKNTSDLIYKKLFDDNLIIDNE